MKRSPGSKLRNAGVFFPSYLARTKPAMQGLGFRVYAGVLILGLEGYCTKN